MDGHHIGVIASSRQDSVTPPTWTNLEYWMKLTETSGGNCYEEVAEAYNGSIGGGAVQSASGVVFDGIDSYCNVPFAARSTNDFTFIMRIYPDSGYSDRAWTGANDASVVLMHDSSYGLQVMQDNIIPPSTATTITMNSDAWNMIAMTRVGNTFRFFINGSFETESYTVTGGTFSGANLKLGYCKDGGGAGWFAGVLRDIAIFSDAKSDAYITAFYNGGSYTDYEDGDPI